MKKMIALLTLGVMAATLTGCKGETKPAELDYKGGVENIIVENIEVEDIEVEKIEVEEVEVNTIHINTIEDNWNDGWGN